MDGLQERFRGGRFLSGTAGFPPLFLDIRMYGCQFFPGLMGSSFDLGSRNILEFFHQAVCQVSSEVNARNGLRKGDGRII